MTDQEIRAKALEIVVDTLALLTPEARKQYLDSNNNDIQHNIIKASDVYEKHIKGK